MPRAKTPQPVPRVVGAEVEVGVVATRLHIPRGGLGAAHARRTKMFDGQSAIGHTPLRHGNSLAKSRTSVGIEFVRVKLPRRCRKHAVCERSTLSVPSATTACGIPRRRCAAACPL